MKKFLSYFPALVFLAVLSPVSAQGLDFGITSYPDERGNTTEGYATYDYSDSLESALRIRHSLDSETTEQKKETSQELTLSKSQFLETFFDPLVWNTAAEGLEFSLSAGAYYSFSTTRQVGHTKYSGALAALKVQSFDNEQTLWAAGPRLGASLDLRFGEVLSVGSSAAAVPFFFFGAEQKIDIYPLVQPAGSHSQNGTGSPFAEAGIHLKLLEYFGVESAWEYQKQKFQSAKPLVTVSGADSVVSWSYPETELEHHRFRILATFNVPIPGDMVFSLGYGRKLDWSWTDGQTQAAVHHNNHIFKASISR